ncbi:MAG TPA: NAD(P)/FAD-dependent oxidoreductase [Bryobacteraceae bacterium]|nr:NAD(P)/FAD-dependent oxidoreductase [Bryobacteraceae bacterium]
MEKPQRVVIIGGGFAGLTCVRSLRGADLEIKLVDRRNFHLFQPLLYQVATGGLSPGDITAPLRSVLRKQKNVQVLMGEVAGFDLSGQRVLLTDGEIPYDTLVLAAGAESHYFGNTDWEQYAPGLKTIEEATEIRRRIFEAFEHAEREPDETMRRAWLRFVVVGGGPTGVELAGAISEIARDTLRDDFRSIRPEEAEILLLEGEPRVLPPFPPDLSEGAERALIGLGVRSRTNVRVTKIDESGVVMKTVGGEQRIEAHTVIWAAGVRANSLGKLLANALGAQTDRGGRVIVNPDLTVPGHRNVFVIGDLAHATGKNGSPLPGVAPVAMQQGRYVARNLKGRLEGIAVGDFHYFDKGTLATIGRNAAVADFGRIHIDGFLAWLTWLFVHLMYIVGFRNRLLVALQWGFQYLTFNRGARLITGMVQPIRPQTRPELSTARVEDAQPTPSDR